MIIYKITAEQDFKNGQDPATTIITDGPGTFAEEMYYACERYVFKHIDPCGGCAFVDTEEWEMPCGKCRRLCKDYWKPERSDCDDV